MFICVIQIFLEQLLTLKDRINMIKTTFICCGGNIMSASLKYENVNYNWKLKSPGWNVDENISLLPSLVGTGGSGRPPGRRVPVREWWEWSQSGGDRQRDRRVMFSLSQWAEEEEEPLEDEEPPAAELPPAAHWSSELPDRVPNSLRHSGDHNGASQPPGSGDRRGDSALQPAAPGQVCGGLEARTECVDGREDDGEPGPALQSLCRLQPEDQQPQARGRRDLQLLHLNIRRSRQSDSHSGDSG